MSEQEQDDRQNRVEHTPDAVIITLLEPLTFKRSKMDDEETLEALTLPRQVKGKHLKAMDQADGEIGKSMALLAKLARVPVHVLDELDSRDFELAMEAMEPFLPERRKTGTR
ncbi:MAG: phage tail assembly protein [Pseudohongiella sp.]